MGLWVLKQLDGCLKRQMWMLGRKFNGMECEIAGVFDGDVKQMNGWIGWLARPFLPGLVLGAGEEGLEGL